MINYDKKIGNFEIGKEELEENVRAKKTLLGTDVSTQGYLETNFGLCGIDKLTESVNELTKAFEKVGKTLGLFYEVAKKYTEGIDCCVRDIDIDELKTWETQSENRKITVDNVECVDENGQEEFEKTWDFFEKNKKLLSKNENVEILAKAVFSKEELMEINPELKDTNKN